MTALPSRSTLRTAFACLWLASAGVACTPEIGDSCSNSLNCSSQSSRECDRTQPGGYCTISPCERGTCPDEGTCVKFRPVQERLATTYCMRKCSDDSDCRDDDGYRCITAEDFGSCNEAETLDGDTRRFCGLPRTLAPDAGTAPPACQHGAATAP
jgi:hypothetical protein